MAPPQKPPTHASEQQSVAAEQALLSGRQYFAQTGEPPGPVGSHRPLQQLMGGSQDIPGSQQTLAGGTQMLARQRSPSQQSSLLMHAPMVATHVQTIAAS